MSITTPSYRPDPERTGIALAVTNKRMIADEVLPRVPVGGYTFQWNKFNIADQMTVPDTIIGRTGVANEVEFGITRETGSVEDHALGAWIPEVDRMEGAKIGYDPLDAHIVALTRVLILRHELHVATSVFTLSTYPTANRATLSGTDQFSHASSKPFDTISAALEVPLMRPNILVFNRPGFMAVRKHPDITARIVAPGSGNSETTNAAGPSATAEQIATLFEVDRVLIGEARLNVAAPGETANNQRVWGNHLAMLYQGEDIVSTIGQDTTFGFVAELGARDAFIEFDKKRGRWGSYYQRVAETKRAVIAANDQAYFLQNIIA
jgi:hypothetical protein